MKEFVLEMLSITKEFPGVKALSDVTIRLQKGEVMALLGENGAGKSTLVKILAGVYQKDSGKILIKGKEATITNPLDAKDKGIGIIYQELCLVPEMTVAENIYLGKEPHKKNKSFVDYQKMYSHSQEILDEFNLEIDARSKISELRIAQQQMIEIVKAISFDADIIVMDEPTSSLSQKEVSVLFQLIHNLKEKQISIIYISHRMEEIFAIADNVTVLRDGSYVGTKAISETNKDELVAMMVGRTVEKFYVKDSNFTDETVMQVLDLVTTYTKTPISFDLKKGEILGVSGLVGAGRSELMRAIFGVDKKMAGIIKIYGKKVNIQKPEDAIKEGIALIPENRKKEGLIIENQVGYNLTLLVLDEFMKGIRVNYKKERLIIENQVANLSIKAYGATQDVINLSGGNQQKIVLGKWLATSPRILILDEPTRGIDVGAKAEIYSLMNSLTKNGVSIIMISSELPEILNMSDRVMVMANGKVTGFFNHSEISQEIIMDCAISQ